MQAIFSWEPKAVMAGSWLQAFRAESRDWGWELWQRAYCMLAIPEQRYLQHAVYCEESLRQNQISGPGKRNNAALLYLSVVEKFIFIVLDIRVNFDLILRYKCRVNELGEKVYDLISSLSNFSTAWFNIALYLTCIGVVNVCTTDVYNLNGVAL